MSFVELHGYIQEVKFDAKLLLCILQFSTLIPTVNCFPAIFRLSNGSSTSQTRSLQSSPAELLFKCSITFVCIVNCLWEADNACVYTAWWHNARTTLTFRWVNVAGFEWCILCLAITACVRNARKHTFHFNTSRRNGSQFVLYATVFVI